MKLKSGQDLALTWEEALQLDRLSKQFEVEVLAHYWKTSPCQSCLGRVGMRTEKTTFFFLRHL